MPGCTWMQGDVGLLRYIRLVAGRAAALLQLLLPICLMRRRMLQHGSRRSHSLGYRCGHDHGPSAANRLVCCRRSAAALCWMLNVRLHICLFIIRAGDCAPPLAVASCAGSVRAWLHIACPRGGTSSCTRCCLGCSSCGCTDSQTVFLSSPYRQNPGLERKCDHASKLACRHTCPHLQHPSHRAPRCHPTQWPAPPGRWVAPVGPRQGCHGPELDDYAVHLTVLPAAAAVASMAAAAVAVASPSAAAAVLLQLAHRGHHQLRAVDPAPAALAAAAAAAAAVGAAAPRLVLQQVPAGPLLLAEQRWGVAMLQLVLHHICRACPGPVFPLQPKPPNVSLLVLHLPGREIANTQIRLGCAVIRTCRLRPKLQHPLPCCLQSIDLPWTKANVSTVCGWQRTQTC